MQSISEACQPLKHDYDACFNDWFREKFLKGEKDNPCVKLFHSYQDCVKVLIA